MKTHTPHRMTMMLTRSAHASPVGLELQWPQPQHPTTDMGRRTRCQAEILGHVAVLEQATLAVLEGYLSGPLYCRAAHSAQRLLALAETLGWREGTRVAQAMAPLFQPAACGLVQALHLSELLAALYRALAPTTAGHASTHERGAAGQDAGPCSSRFSPRLSGPSTPFPATASTEGGAQRVFNGAPSPLAGRPGQYR
jgi:hypothetical protein